jgi:hypothetical protein
LQAALPANVQLMTLQSINETSVLMRLAHLFGINEDPQLSQPVSVDISSLFDASHSFQVVGVQEVSLTNNQDKARLLKRRREALQWTAGAQETRPHPWRQSEPLDFARDAITTLGPLEIKTFVLTVQP